MATNVFKHAKTLRKKPSNRNKSWAQLVKQSANELRGKRKPARKKSVKKRVAKKKTARKRKVSGTVIRRKISGTVAQHISAAQAQLKEQIGWAEAMKFSATKKTVKRKIAKRIAELKSKYRKLC